MKQVTINVPENKFFFFMKLMHSLPFVKVVEAPQRLEDQLTPKQKEIWHNVKQGFEELKLVEEGKLKHDRCRIFSMNFDFILLPNFSRELKRLAKKYPSIKADL